MSRWKVVYPDGTEHLWGREDTARRERGKDRTITIVELRDTPDLWWYREDDRCWRGVLQPPVQVPCTKRASWWVQIDGDQEVAECTQHMEQSAKSRRGVPVRSIPLPAKARKR